VRLAVYQPEIPQNLGSMIRLCACFGVPLDIIEPCSFPFSVKSLRRVAMDYTELAEIRRHDSWDAFQKCNAGIRNILLTTKSSENLWDFKFRQSDVLLLGRESSGVPDDVHDAMDARIKLPMPGGGRSMNVTICAGIALAEALRQGEYWTKSIG